MQFKYGDLSNNVLAGTDNETNFIYGDGSFLPQGATGGNDTLTGGANTGNVPGLGNVLYGETQVMSNSTGGNDTLTGGANALENDVYFQNDLYGDAQYMFNSTGGDDTIIGGANSVNYLFGDAANVYDSIGGDDRLVSATNTIDHMTGDGYPHAFVNSIGGQDVFVFAPDNGTDYIHDFRQGEDHIELDGFHKTAGKAGDRIPAQALKNLPLITFADLNIETVDANNDGVLDSVIHLNANNSITVDSVTGLTANDFFFVV